MLYMHYGILVRFSFIFIIKYYFFITIGLFGLDLQIEKFTTGVVSLNSILRYMHKVNIITFAEVINILQDKNHQTMKKRDMNALGKLSRIDKT